MFHETPSMFDLTCNSRISGPGPQVIVAL